MSKSLGLAKFSSHLDSAGAMTDTTVISSVIDSDYVSARVGNLGVDSATVTGIVDSDYIIRGLAEATIDEELFVATASQTDFTLNRIVNNEETILVSLDGVVQPSNAYTMDSSVMSFASGLTVGTNVKVMHLGFLGNVADGSITLAKLDVALTTITEDLFSSVSGQTEYTLSKTPLATSSILVSIDGIIQPSSAYSLDSTIMTISPALDSGTDVRVVHLATVGAGKVYDSAAVQSQIDSAFPSAFDTRFALQDTHDSAAVQAQINSTAVTLTGDQTIAGIKAFSDSSNFDDLVKIRISNPQVNINGGAVIGDNFANRIAPLTIGFIPGVSPATTDSSALLFDGNQIEQAMGTNSIYLNYNSPANVRMVEGGGLVGIGASSPQQRLHLLDSNVLPLLIQRKNTTSDDWGSGVVFGNDFSNNGTFIFGAPGTGMRFGNTSDITAVNPVSSPIGSEFMRLSDSGDLGVGDGDPRYRLDVHDDIQLDPWVIARFQNDATTGNPYGGIMIAAKAQSHIRMMTNGTEWDDAGAYKWQIRLPTAGGATAADKLSIYSWTKADDVLEIENNGSVLLPHQPRFHAYGPSAGTINTYFTFQNTRMNNGSHYSTTTGRFTAPTAGAYFFTWSAIANTGADVYRYYIHKNGAVIGDIQLRLDNTNNSGAYEFGTRNYIMDLAANDYVQIYFTSASSTSYIAGDYVTFSGYLIG